MAMPVLTGVDSIVNWERSIEDCEAGATRQEQVVVPEFQNPEGGQVSLENMFYVLIEIGDLDPTMLPQKPTVRKECIRKQTNGYYPEL
eukprot:4776463-Pyramimonas_sp.AAC.1